MDKKLQKEEKSEEKMPNDESNIIDEDNDGNLFSNFSTDESDFNSSTFDEENNLEFARCLFSENEALPSEANDPPALIDNIKFPHLAYFLKTFLFYKQNMFENTMTGLTTQSNKSLNAKKVQFANKTKNWKKSFKVRMALNILQKNNPFIYYSDLIEYLSLPKLSEESFDILNKYSTKSSLAKEKNANPIYSKKRNKMRYDKKNKKYTQTKNDHVIRIKEMKKTEGEIDKIVHKF